MASGGTFDEFVLFFGARAGRGRGGVGGSEGQEDESGEGGGDTHSLQMKRGKGEVARVSRCE